MLCGYHNVPPQHDIVISENGLLSDEFQYRLEQSGLRVVSGVGDASQLMYWLDRQCPVVVLTSYQSGHWVVVTKLGKRVTLLDPSSGEVRVDYNEFMAKWQEMDSYFIVAY